MLRLTNIKKSYGISGTERLEVLKGIDLQVGKGEIVAIVGQSGAGKSTLLHIIGTLDRPDSGTYEFNGSEVMNLNDKKISEFRNKEIGFIFQFHHLLPEFTALENVMIASMIGGRDDKSAAERMLAEVGLKNRMNHKPSELSGGESQRVAIARALVNSPGLILADEPTGNLDSENSEAIMELIFELRKKLGKTFIIVTHNDSFASRCDRVISLQDGKVIGTRLLNSIETE
ncbi:MAG: ABC transporter ATP-binding protein [Ignavibacteria bacterium]|nr:ABC transporter ATP-binding protein [Ignavibacteria bacterium]MBK9228901.1 ABC transporter ATP-binding protein [Ignavibacteria bacterium]